MRLRRYEFGISKVTPAGVEVYARRGDGRLYFRTYPHGTPDLLTLAQAEFGRTYGEWHTTAPPAEVAGLSLVYENGARVHVSGEAAIDSGELWDAAPDLIVSMNEPKPETLATIGSYLAETHRARHLALPMLDVLPEFQSPTGKHNARLALAEISKAIAANERIAVHCLMGIHRSVSVATVALTRAKRFDKSRNAFLHIQARRRVASWIPETVEWLEQLG